LSSRVMGLDDDIVAAQVEVAEHGVGIVARSRDQILRKTMRRENA
jgi:hypothetical protein